MTTTPPAAPATETPDIDKLLETARGWPRECEGNLINELADEVERQRNALQAANRGKG